LLGFTDMQANSLATVASLKTKNDFTSLCYPLLIWWRGGEGTIWN